MYCYIEINSILVIIRSTINSKKLNLDLYFLIAILGFNGTKLDAKDDDN